MKLGDKKTIQPMVDGVLGTQVTGRVVYIHPKRRYYMVEYTGANGSPLRESFAFEHRRGDG